MTSSNKKPFAVAGIGASAGGLEAFTELLQILQADKYEHAGVVINEATELRNALDKVMKEGTAFKKDNIRIKYNGDFKSVSIGVIPLKVPAANQKHFLISFMASPRVPLPLPAGKVPEKSDSKPGSPEHELKKELSGVKEELLSTKASMQSIQELNAALEEQGSKLKTSNVELQHFAAVASHDLQVPFQIISNFMGLLAAGYNDKLEPRAQELIKIAEDAARRAQSLINGLLNYAKVDTGERNLETVDMKLVVRQALSDLRHQVEESSAETICDPLPQLMGDPLHLTRLFQNLISNAIKYRSERPLKIHISTRKENKDWIFQIKDNGVGFDPKYKVQAFDMFKRLQDSEISGVGIGLATCKKIVERHGGKIWAESEPGKGSSFYFSIPDQTDHPRNI